MAKRIVIGRDKPAKTRTRTRTPRTVEAKIDLLVIHDEEGSTAMACLRTGMKRYSPGRGKFGRRGRKCSIGDTAAEAINAMLTKQTVPPRAIVNFTTRLYRAEAAQLEAKKEGK